MNLNNIRKPDEIINECLINENKFINEHDKELQEILNFTLLEYEKKCIDDYENKKKQFTLLLNELKRVSNYDKEVKEVYNIIEPIIDCYCCCDINKIELDLITNNKIFKIIESIRIDKKYVDNLKNIFK